MYTDMSCNPPQVPKQCTHFSMTTDKMAPHSILKRKRVSFVTSLASQESCASQVSQLSHASNTTSDVDRTTNRGNFTTGTLTQQVILIYSVGLLAVVGANPAAKFVIFIGTHPGIFLRVETDHG
jgi:hypothetical protein